MRTSSAGIQRKTSTHSYSTVAPKLSAYSVVEHDSDTSTDTRTYTKQKKWIFDTSQFT